MHADELPVRFQKNQLQESTTSSNRAARSETEVRTANLVIKPFLATLLFGQTSSGDFWHSVNRRHGARVHDAFEGDSEGMTDRRSPLLHSNRRQRRPKHIASGVDTLRRSMEV